MIPSRKEGGLKHMTHRTKCSSGQEPHTERNSEGTQHSGKGKTFPFLCREPLPMQSLPPDTGSPARNRNTPKNSGEVLRERGQSASWEI